MRSLNQGDYMLFFALFLSETQILGYLGSHIEPESLQLTSTLFIWTVFLMSAYSFVNLALTSSAQFFLEVL